jgi:hypothetical protein
MSKLWVESLYNLGVVLIKEKYSVMSIDKTQYSEWLKYKHYAKRIPQVSFAFGLFNSANELIGCCTFGLPCRMMNDGYCIFTNPYSVKTMELNRLVVNEGLDKNVLSYFVSRCLKHLPKPMCIVSYADENSGHHGYIYQATNWIYTGISKSESTYFDVNTNKYIHPRTIVSTYGSRNVDSVPDNIIVGNESRGKHRYFMFIGTKADIRNMKKYFKYSIEQYPKGDNKRYNASYEPSIQEILF